MRLARRTHAPFKLFVSANCLKKDRAFLVIHEGMTDWVPSRLWRRCHYQDAICAAVGAYRELA